MEKANQERPIYFLTMEEAAKELKISVRSLQALIKSGEVRALRLGKKIIRIPLAELERLAAVAASK